MAFKPAIVLDKLQTLVKLEQDLSAAYEKAGKSLDSGDGEDSDSGDSKNSVEKKDEKKDAEKKEDARAKDSLTAKTKDEDDKQQPKKESLDTKKQLMRLLFEDGADGEEEEDKPDPEVEKAEKACFDFYNKFQAKMEKEAKPKLDKDDFRASRKSFYGAIATANKLRAENSDEAKLQLKKTAAGELKTYFETFCGKENVRGLDEKSMVIYLVGIGDGKAKASDFAGMVSKDRSAIAVEDGSKEVQDAIEKAQADESKANDDIKCYAAVVAGYKINLD